LKVELESQVITFVRKQAPEPRRRLREALRASTRSRGDIKGLEPPLEEYQRLRVGPYRIIFRQAGDRVRCVFAERRGIVYEVFSEILLEGP
jgi:mRNA-degrading endonuclease RelE of RelBE toxin-antitoxin system